MNPLILKALIAKHGYNNLISINVTSGSTFQVHKPTGEKTRYQLGFDWDNGILIVSQNRDTSDTRYTVDYVDMVQIEAVVFNGTPAAPDLSFPNGITPSGFELN
jgi:hypothetical protein